MKDNWEGFSRTELIEEFWSSAYTSPCEITGVRKINCNIILDDIMYIDLRILTSSKKVEQMSLLQLLSHLHKVKTKGTEDCILVNSTFYIVLGW